MTSSNDNTTHFGYRTVKEEDKSNLVAEVFRSVAPKYDLMNDLMSFGLHRLWKRFTINEADIREGMRILDVASGTGDLAKAFAKRVGKSGKVVMTDINEAMLTVGRERMIDAGLFNQMEFMIVDAEHLPFPDNDFDRITIAFGLRNVTHKEAALRDMYRALKPGGKCLILEFSHPTSPIMNQLYDLYSFNIIPKLGQLVTNDKESYQYLVESIRMHPKQEELKKMMQDAGFEDVKYFNLNFGIVALHVGYKY